MTDPCVPKNGVCLQHGCAPLVLDGQCQVGFDSGWTDMMTDDAHRDARDRAVGGAIRDLKNAIDWQCNRIREPDALDRIALETLATALRLLGGVPLKERVKPIKRRRAKP